MSSNEQQLLTAWIEFLGGYVWHHAIALTTRRACTREALEREFSKRFVPNLARMTQRPVAWFFAFEDRVGNHPHLHAILGGTERLNVHQCQSAWKAGFSRVRTLRAEILDDSEGAARYAVKSLGRFPDDYDLSRRWIPIGRIDPDPRIGLAPVG
jgi:hypothetical protein